MEVVDEVTLRGVISIVLLVAVQHFPGHGHDVQSMAIEVAWARVERKELLRVVGYHRH